MGRHAQAAGGRGFGHPLRLEIEPGRYLVAESGYLVSEIRAVKQMGDNTFYLLDAGLQQSGPADPVRRLSSDVDRARRRAAAPSRPLRDVIVGGPLCESGDIFTQEEGGFVSTRSLPAAEVGDYLVIECAGAYGFVMGSNYNSKPLAAEVLIRSGQPHLVRQRQTTEDLLRGEVVPADV